MADDEQKLLLDMQRLIDVIERDYGAVVQLPKSESHARAMLAVATAYLKDKAAAK